MLRAEMIEAFAARYLTDCGTLEEIIPRFSVRLAATERGPAHQWLAPHMNYWGPISEGAPSAQQVLAVLSGTHGVERPAGYRVQRALLDCEFQNLPSDQGLAVIHGVNPWGAAWGRRVTSGNIDLNRNGAVANNPLYTAVADLLHPKVWGEDAISTIMAQTRTEDGMAAIKAAAVVGQSTHPDGLFYSGTERCREWTSLMDLIVLLCQRAETAVVIDIHTGLQSPTGSPVDFFGSETEESSATAAIREILKGRSVIFPKIAAAGMYNPQGDILTGMRQALINVGSDCQLLAFAAEFPTGVPLPVALLRLAAENWVHHHPGVLQPQDEANITHEFLKLFAPMRDADWVERVRDIGLEVAASALHYLNR